MNLICSKTGSDGNLPGEIWKDVTGFEGFYKISNKGRLARFHSENTWKIMSFKNKSGWYLTIQLVRKGRTDTKKIHRLVAEAFIPNPKNYPEVNHKDGNKQNNCVENLEWCTHKQNVIHSMGMHKHQCDKMNYYNKYIRPTPIDQYSLDGRFLKTYRNAKEASDSTGVCQRNILLVARQTPYNKKGSTRSQAGGYVWKLHKGGD